MSLVPVISCHSVTCGPRLPPALLTSSVRLTWWGFCLRNIHHIKADMRRILPEEYAQYQYEIPCSQYCSGIILFMCPANERWRYIVTSSHERWRYIVTSSLIGWMHTQNDPWLLLLICQWTLPKALAISALLHRESVMWSFDEDRHENDFTEKYPQHKDEIPFAHSCCVAFLILGKIVML